MEQQETYKNGTGQFIKVTEEMAALYEKNDFPGNEGGVWEADIKDLRTIPLTKEFFTRNGFIEQVDCSEYGTYMRSTDLRTEVLETSGGWSVHIDDDHFISVFGKCLKYVHEFQNAYYVSTGEELQIEL